MFSCLYFGFQMSQTIRKLVKLKVLKCTPNFGFPWIIENYDHSSESFKKYFMYHNRYFRYQKIILLTFIAHFTLENISQLDEKLPLNSKLLNAYFEAVFNLLMR